jgi:hypothetical protein
MDAPLQLALNLASAHRNQYLFSDHYLNHLLPNDARWAEALPQAESFLAWLQAHYAQEKDQLPQYNENQLEEHWFKPILTRLGHVFEGQASLPGLDAGVEYPDYVFFPDQATRQAAVGAQKTQAYSAQALAVGEVKRWDVPLGKRQKGGGPSFEARSPSVQIDYYVRITGLDWGLLSNGRLWRLVHKDSSYRLSVYYEVDLVDLLDQETAAQAMRYFTLFFRQAAFRPDAQGRVFLDDALAASHAYAVALEEDLRQNAYQALERLMQGFLDLAANGLGPEDLDEIYDNSLYLLYRLLFILYGESRGLLPLQSQQYRANYSLARIKQDIADLSLMLAPMTTVYWPRLHNLFHIINGEDPELNRYLDVPRYNGGLFDPRLHPFLEQKVVGDQALLEAIDLLSRRATGSGREFVDYRTLGVRHLGSIYEGLLECRPCYASEPMVAVRDGKGERWARADDAPNRARVVERREAGQVYLETDRGERKASGSYYTPQYIVAYIVEHTLGPLVDEAVQRVKARAKAAKGQAARTQAEQSLVDEVLNLKVLDPAMGSGHFLVEATEFLALALATDPYVETGDLGEEDLTHWKRRVVERCIYGVDKNPLAVELAKLSLWLATVAADKPLSFLDHHLVCGDSLVGARVADLGWPPPAILNKKARQQLEQQKNGQLNMFAYLLQQRLPVMMGKVLEITGVESDSYETVQAKEAADQAVRELKAPFQAVADLWVSAHFGNTFGPGEYDQALGLIGRPGELSALPAVQRAREMGGERAFFHWELAFPEVFYDRHGRSLGDGAGFDVVVGNPPYGAEFDDSEKAWLKNYHLVEYQFESYIAFAERAMSFTVTEGRHSFVVPDSWLVIKFARSFREYLLEHTALETLVDLPQGVFGDATVDAMIYVIQNSLPTLRQETEVVIFDHADTRPDFNFPAGRFKRLQSVIASDDSSRFHLSPKSLHQILIQRNGLKLVPLGALATVGLGCKPYQTGKGTPPQTNEIKRTKPFNSNYKIDESYYPFYLGDGAQRYFALWHGQWIKYGSHLAEPRNFSMFEGSRIIVQGIRNPSLERRLVAAYLDGVAITNDNLTTIQIADISYSLFYILALINSEFMNWVYTQSRGTFTKITVDGLSNLPIHRVDFTTPTDKREQLISQTQTLHAAADHAALLAFTAERLAADPAQADVVHDLLAYLAGQMIEMNKQKQTAVENFWLDLEGVTGAAVFETLRNQGKQQVTLWKRAPACRPFVSQESRSTCRLEESLTWDEEAFKAFLKLLVGQVQGLSALVGVYRDHSPGYRALAARLRATDRLIDQIVYKLYGLTEQEIAVVEGHTGRVLGK